MSLKINTVRYVEENKIKNYVLFSDENFHIKSLNNLSLGKDSAKINQTIKNNVLKDKNFLLFNLNPNQKILLVKIKNANTSLENEKIGAEFYNFVKKNSLYSVTIFDINFYNFNKQNKFFLEEFLHGATLKSYESKKYITKKGELETSMLQSLAKNNVLQTFEHKGYFYSINDKKELNLAKQKLKKSK